MENATEAMKMAFGFIMFVLALTLSISSFSQARSAVESITTMKDRETQYTYVSPSSDSSRVVGVETIVPTMYKAYKENFRVVFYDGRADANNYQNSPIYLYTYIDPNGNQTRINYIDLEEEILPGASEAISHLNQLLDAQANSSSRYRKQFDLHPEGLYKYLEGKKFKELLGEYYQEDKKELDAGGTVNTEINNVNKTKKRIITYVLIN